MKIEALLEKLSNMICVSGGEFYDSKKLNAVLAPYGRISSDNLHNIVLVKESKQEPINIIMLDAHIDEIGMAVTHITENGFLKVIPLGGLDPKVCYGADVVVIGKKILNGVFATTSSHLSNEENQNLVSVENLLIDIGMNFKEASKLVQLGDKVVFKSKFLKLKNKVCAGKAMDNRVSCAALIYMLELLKNTEFCHTQINVVFSTTEEVGGYASGCAAFYIKPTDCIVLDATFASLNGINDNYGKFNKGPMIGISPLLDDKLTEELKNTAKTFKIPYQLEIMGNKTGTNADHLLPILHCKKPALVSIPIRYMHSPVESVNTEDIKSTANLLVEFVKTKEDGIK